MELLAFSVTGTFALLLAQCTEVFEPWSAQRVAVRVLPAKADVSVSAGCATPLKKAA